MKRLLILNGSHSDIPLIEAGKKLGYRVVTTGNEPLLIGHKFADEYHPADFSDRDAVLELARHLKVDAVCACANDFGALSAAWVAEQLGLPGHDAWSVALTVHLKDHFRRFAEQHNLPTPPAICFTDIDGALSCEMPLPVIVKPVDLTGGKGITRVERPSEYDAAIRHAFARSRCKRIVVEEFVKGTQHSLTTFIRDKKVIFQFSDNEFSYRNPFLVSTSAGPANDFECVEKELIAAIELIASSLKLVDGVVHVQYLLSEGKPVILEVTRRCSGDLYPGPVERATRVPWAEWIVRAECGLSSSDFPVAQQTGFVGRHCIMSPQNGILRDVIIAAEVAACVWDQLTWWRPGDHISHCMQQKLGVLQLEYTSREQMLSITDRINELVRVVLE